MNHLSKHIHFEMPKHNENAEKEGILRTFFKNVGNLINHWWWGGDPDERNPISGMTLRDIYNVQSSWVPIHANASRNGFLIFQRLFLADPETKATFGLAKLSDSEMVNYIPFKAHILHLMTPLNTSIHNLNKPELVVVWMTKLGDVHQKLHTKRKHFLILKSAMVDVLQNELKLNDNKLESWERFITFIYGHILPRLSS